MTTCLSQSSAIADPAAYPFVLLASVWLTAGPVLTANQTLHSLREAVLGAKKIESSDLLQRRLTKESFLWNSYLPLLVGVLLYLLLLTAILVVVAVTRVFFQPDGLTNLLCVLVAFLPGFSFAGFLYGGLGDFLAMWSVILDEKNAEPDAEMRAHGILERFAAIRIRRHRRTIRVLYPHIPPSLFSRAKKLLRQ